MSHDEPLARVREADAALTATGSLPIAELTAVAVGTVLGLSRSEWWVPGPRERAAGVLRGASIDRLRDPWSGAAPYKIAPAAPLRALHAVGLCMADPADRRSAVAVHLGVGSVADGSFHEALNLAALHRLPVVFVVATRSLDGAPVPTQTASAAGQIAAGHGVVSHAVDGRDVEAVQRAVNAARQMGAPVVIEAHV